MASELGKDLMEILRDPRLKATGKLEAIEEVLEAYDELDEDDDPDEDGKDAED